MTTPTGQGRFARDPQNPTEPGRRNANQLAQLLNLQLPNVFLAGPVAAPGAAPTFRAIVTADLPAGTGTVTSVALTVPAALLSVSGSPITTSGTFAIALPTRAANLVFAGPSSGGVATPTFRGLVAADLPTLSPSMFATQNAGYVMAGPATGSPATPTFRPLVQTDIPVTGLSELVFSNTSVPAGNTVANTAAATAFTSSYTIPANSIAAGDNFDIDLRGLYGTAIAPPTLNVQILLGGIQVLATTAITLVGSLSNTGWYAKARLTFFTAGATAACDAQGDAHFATAATTQQDTIMPNSGTIAIDTTANQTITVKVTWGTASASNTITLRQLTVVKNNNP